MTTKTQKKETMPSASLNFKRARRAAVALLASIQANQSGKKFRTTSDSWQEQMEDLTDILTDLRHWARCEDVDFEKAVEASRSHFNEEVEAERREEDRVAASQTVKGGD